MDLFSINYSALIKYLLPVRKRKTKRISWLRALIGPVMDTWSLFSAGRISSLYYLGRNGQVVYLQAVLNDTFDNELRRITITDTPYIGPVPIYKRPEGKPCYFFARSENTPVFLYTRQELASAVNGFIVTVPATVTLNNAQMKALIDKYRLTSKSNYLIVTI